VGPSVHIKYLGKQGLSVYINHVLGVHLYLYHLGLYIVYTHQVVWFSKCIPCGAAGLSVVWAEWNLIVYKAQTLPIGGFS
jgi:hypothetical protein